MALPKFLTPMTAYEIAAGRHSPEARDIPALQKFVEESGNVPAILHFAELPEADFDSLQKAIVRTGDPMGMVNFAQKPRADLTFLEAHIYASGDARAIVEHVTMNERANWTEATKAIAKTGDAQAMSDLANAYHDKTQRETNRLMRAASQDMHSLGSFCAQVPMADQIKALKIIYDSKDRGAYVHFAVASHPKLRMDIREALEDDLIAFGNPEQVRDYAGRLAYENIRFDEAKFLAYFRKNSAVLEGKTFGAFLEDQRGDRTLYEAERGM